MRASLRRTLTLRFAATMAAGLLFATGAFYWAASRALYEPVTNAVLKSELLVSLVAIVIAGTSATLIGAWHFTSLAIRPVAEITAQATQIESSTLNQRIIAHADTEEYEGLVAVLNRMLERLEASFAAQRRLTADVSHELRTPLTALRGEIEVALRAERSPREYQLVLRSALEEIDRLTTMGEDLLLITRAAARLLTLQREPTDFDQLVDRALQAFRRRLEEKDITIDRQPAGKRAVSIDPALAARVVDHLLENALAHTPASGRILVAVEEITPERVRLVIANSGLSIAPEHLPHLFEPFYRTDPSRTRIDGSGGGLGLAMVDAIARLHDGAARVVSNPSGGTRLEVDFTVPVNT